MYEVRVLTINGDGLNVKKNSLKSASFTGVVKRNEIIIGINE